MKNIKLKDLERNPDTFFEIPDDDTVKHLLLELGIIDKFSKSVEGVESTNQVLTAECKTHNIIVLLFTGKTIKTDNGYLFYGLPKSKYSQAQMDEFYTKLMIKIGRHSKHLHSVSRFSPDSSGN